MTTLEESSPEGLARAWLAVDPEPATRAETEQLIEAGPDQLKARFGSTLDFGTAGIRGPLGAGPTRMNRVLVRLVASALADQIVDEPDPHVVIGYDARHGSHDFAVDTARVLLARDIRCTILPRALPTPVLAFTVRNLEASAGVMVTASHNPKDDNGYKVYWRGGALLTSPLDREIASTMQRTPLLSDLDLVPLSDARLAPGSEQLIDDYLKAIIDPLDPTNPRSAIVVHSALHGVGTETIDRAFSLAGFNPIVTVAEQATPDPDFPTTPFPNPEEPGTLDLLLALGDTEGADIALANDPDADRLAVAVPTECGWHYFSGDDVGALLADYLLRRPAPDDRTALVVTTVTSSRLLSKIAAAYHADYAETLTGFKWIMHARQEHPDHRFVMGYEEALGYAVNELVPDKDGISAALTIAALASELKEEGKTLLDRLDELHLEHGIHVTGQRAVRFESLAGGRSGQAAAVERLRDNPPESIDGSDVLAVHDLALGETGLPPTSGVVLELPDARLVVRPSGTEPKMKLYAEVTAQAGDDLITARTATRRRLRRILDEAVLLACAIEAAESGATTVDTSAVDHAFQTVTVGRGRAADLALVVRCIDLTTLEGNDTKARIRALCAQARRPDATDPTVGPVAAICVYPEFIGAVAEMTNGTSIAVATVAGAFPHGLAPISTRLAEIEAAVRAGADEVDIVLNRSALIDGDTERVADELARSRQAASGVHLKVILEVGELNPDLISVAARLACDAGADFIKTSTGKAKVNATPEAVWLMAGAIQEYFNDSGRRVGLKIAGGVRTADEALGYVNIVRTVLGDDWLRPELFRFGASSLLDAVVDELGACSQSEG